MNKEKKLSRNLGLQLAAAGVSGLLLTSAVFAQSDSNDQDRQAGQSQGEFSDPESKPEANFGSSQSVDENAEREEQGQAQRERQERDQEMAGEEAWQREEPEKTTFGDQQQASQQQQQSEQQGLDSMTIDELEGQKVVTSDGAEIGKVDRVVMSSDQRQAGVVLSVGGFLGLGAKPVMAPLDRLKMEDDQLVWDTSMTKDEIEQTSSFEEGDYERVSSENYQNVGELRQGAR